ncbi:MAG: deoxyribose-phosphate aldolase, partial [Actinomycetes bacterium]
MTAARVEVADLVRTRVESPGRIARLATERRRPTSFSGATGRLMLVAADHPARGALASGGDAMAMADRRSLLARLVEALAHPDVDGVLG